MKERMTISIDKDIYDAFQSAASRRVSLSEVISWVLRAMCQDIKRGKELTSQELQEWMDSTPEGRDFRERLKEHWGPAVEKIDATVGKVKKAVKLDGKKKRGK